MEGGSRSLAENANGTSPSSKRDDSGSNPSRSVKIVKQVVVVTRRPVIVLKPAVVQRLVLVRTRVPCDSKNGKEPLCESKANETTTGDGQKSDAAMNMN
jgi:hypothetical protein